ncbi:unnamed protein product [Phytomonas sp. Hart1]|eukprot:CCW68948.1 unnamed protein product [Phytomonas sp. isolate Hart1]
MTHIPMKWAEREDRLYLTLQVTAARDVRVDFEAKKITVSGTGLTAQTAEPREIRSELPLLKEIAPAESTYKVLGVAIQICAIKKEAGYWNQVVDLPARQTKTWLSVDWNLWKDENDAPEEDRGAGFGGYGDMSSMLGGGQGGMDFASMMQNMPPGGGDSDDEDEDYPVDGEADEDEDVPKESTPEDKADDLKVNA